MKLARLLILTIGIAIAFSGAVPLLKRIFADTKPTIQLNITSTAPRAVEDSTQQAIVRDYSAAWQGLSSALANNSVAPLAENFTGYALDKLTERVKEQQIIGPLIMRAKAIASDTNMSNNYDESHGAFVTRWHHPCGIVPECAVRVTG